MAPLPRVQASNLPSVSEDFDSTTASPARGRETRTALLQKLRPPPLVHAWDFWHEKPPIATDLAAGRAIRDEYISRGESSPASSTAATTAYNTNLSLLHSVTDVRTFWTLFNNFSFSSLPPRTSVHLFHKSVLPVWEHPRNVHGGAWIFRLPAASASTFFRSLALLAIGEQLQEAVADDKKVTFRDDICGISFVVKSERTTAVSVWNRDAGNEGGIRRILETVLEGVAEEGRPKEGSYYYKKHRDHAGFSPDGDKVAKEKTDVVETKDPKVEEESKAEMKQELEQAKEKSSQVTDSLAAMEAEFEKVRKILQEVDVKDAEMNRKVAMEVGREEGKVDDGLRGEETEKDDDAGNAGLGASEGAS